MFIRKNFMKIVHYFLHLLLQYVLADFTWTFFGFSHGVYALKIKEQLIVLGYMEKVQQVHKRTETDNNRRTVIHWFYWGEQEEMELTWTYPQTRPRNTSQKSHENYFWKKVKYKIQRKKKSNNSHHNKSLYKENQGGQSFLWH